MRYIVVRRTIAYTFDSRTSLVDQAASVLAEVLDAIGAVRRGPPITKIIKMNINKE